MPKSSKSVDRTCYMYILYQYTLMRNSIVLVHGLHGDREKTWTKNLGNDSICWPKDLLPSDVKKTRVLTFGYASNIIHFWGSRSENRMGTFSNDLFQRYVESSWSDPLKP